MQTAMVDTTDANAPYNVLRNLRCQYEFQGTKCTGRAGDIDWGQPAIHAFKCPKCKTMNVVRIVEVVRP